MVMVPFVIPMFVSNFWKNANVIKVDFVYTEVHKNSDKVHHPKR